MKYWLMKSEPSCFSIDDLAHAENKTTCWDGVRNYQARNFMRDDMSEHDLIFFYHSNCNPPGIVGIAEVCSKPYPDHTAFDPTSEHPDSKSTPEKPIWYMVDVKLVKKFDKIISLGDLKNNHLLKNMLLLRKGNRLSVLPVTKDEWDVIVGMQSFS